MSRPEANPQQLSIVKKFSTVFAILFIIPMMVTLYLLFASTLDLEGKKVQILCLIFFCALLGMAGYLTLRRIVKSLVETVDNVRAVASGDLEKRARADTGDEISEIASNFNKITEKLQKNVEDLRNSKRQIQSLLGHIAKAIETPFELERLVTVYLSSILNIIGYRKGVMTAVTGKGDFRIVSNIGLTKEEKKSFSSKGSNVFNRVIDQGRPVIISQGLHRGGDGEDFYDFHQFIGDSVSLPLIKSHNVFGVLTVAAGSKIHGSVEGTVKTGSEIHGSLAGKEDPSVVKRVDDDDIIMLQNLSAQISTALENAQLRKKMEETYFESIAALAAAVEARDIYTNGHSMRVSLLSREIALEMGLPERIASLAHDASLLHDIGKIGIPDTILHNSSPTLPERYYDVIKTHPVIGENILKPLHSLYRLCSGVRSHHERYDGNGYPDGLSAAKIPIEARVICVADAFDAMTSNRSYRGRLSRSEAIEQLMENEGTQFDADAVKALLRYLDRNPDIGDPVTDNMDHFRDSTRL